MTDDLYLLTLLATPRVGPQAVRFIQQFCPDPPVSLRDLRNTLLDARTQNSRLYVPTLDELEEAQTQAIATLDVAERQEIVILTPSHPHFPVRLRAIKNPPVVLFAKGSTDCLNEDASVAVIGTREPSEYGARLANKFGSMFAKMSFVVVSGLAIGCDTEAHRGCLRVGGRAVAVMAHGLDMVYPAENRKLAQEIIESSGCLVSEYPPRERPRRNYFVERDRLQSAFSAGVVVAETDIKGGTMHTVGFCLEQGKPLACLSHPPKYGDHPKGNGNRYLIAKGDAVPLATPSDVELFAHLLMPSHRVAQAATSNPFAFDFTESSSAMDADVIADNEVISGSENAKPFDQNSLPSGTMALVSEISNDVASLEVKVDITTGDMHPALDLAAPSEANDRVNSGTGQTMKAEAAKPSRTTSRRKGTSKSPKLVPQMVFNELNGG